MIKELTETAPIYLVVRVSYVTEIQNEHRTIRSTPPKSTGNPLGFETENESLIFECYTSNTFNSHNSTNLNTKYTEILIAVHQTLRSAAFRSYGKVVTVIYIL